MMEIDLQSYMGILYIETYQRTQRTVGKPQKLIIIKTEILKVAQCIYKMDLGKVLMLLLWINNGQNKNKNSLCSHIR